jgi:DNA-binding response OmpR family regulator
MGNPLRILIVDDDPSICKALAMDLTRDNVGVETALNGKTGILLGSCNRYDILITDLCLPDISGFEVLTEIRQYLPDIVPIIITGNASVKSTVKALRLGVFDYLEKPFPMNSVRNTIEKAIEKRKSTPLNSTEKNNTGFLNTQMLVHQINNPLSAIMGSAYLAMMHPQDTGSVEKQMRNIVKATLEVGEISRKLFAPAGKLPVDSRGIIIQQVVENCVAIFDDLLSFKGIQCEKDIAVLSDTSVPGDRFNYDQIFKNLISNAIDAMAGNREKRLTIKAAFEADRQPLVSISIADTGCGIAPPRLKTIFTPGFTTKPNGSGLGLYVVESMVKKLNCQIQCDSQLGVGTTFTLRIPLNSEPQNKEN